MVTFNSHKIAPFSDCYVSLVLNRDASKVVVVVEKALTHKNGLEELLCDDPAFNEPTIKVDFSKVKQ